LAIGLTVSALARSSEVAIALLPLILIPMVILAGVLQPLHKMNSAASLLSQVMPSRWAFEGLLLLETKERPTWTQPNLPALPTAGQAAALTEGADETAQDMAEKFFPADGERTGSVDSGLVLFVMLVLLVGSIHIILRIRDVQ
jgi:hypothetical protein